MILPSTAITVSASRIGRLQIAAQQQSDVANYKAGLDFSLDRLILGHEAHLVVEEFNNPDLFAAFDSSLRPLRYSLCVLGGNAFDYPQNLKPQRTQKRNRKGRKELLAGLPPNSSLEFGTPQTML